MNINNLCKAGYKKSSGDFKNKYCTGLYQKAIKDNNGKSLYWINIYYYKYPVSLGITEACGVGVQFYINAGIELEKPINVEFDISDRFSFVDCEKLLAEMYEKLGCIPDPHNE